MRVDELAVDDRGFQLDLRAAASAMIFSLSVQSGLAW